MEKKIKYSSFCNKKVSNIGYGCATLAELYNEFNSNEYLDILKYSYKNGINYYDVAPFYGGGLAEKRLGADSINFSASRAAAIPAENVSALML